MRSIASLRIGLIGIGTVGALHLHAYRALQSVNVVAIADADPEQLGRIAHAGALQCYSGAAEMLAAEDLDIACILTPASSHEGLVTLCADAKVDILCEKPLAPNPESARRMIQVAHDNGVRLFYGSSYRFLPALVAAREAIRSGRIGDVLLMREQAIGGRGTANAIAMPAAHYPTGGPGGFAMGLIDHGIHLIDAFGWLVDSPVRSAHGQGNVSGGQLGTEFLYMEFSCGAMGVLLYNECTFGTSLPSEGMFAEGDGWDIDGFVRSGQWAKYPSCIHIHGARGSLRVFQYANKVFLTDDTGVRQLPVRGLAPPHHFGAQMMCFAEDIKAGRAPSTPAEAGLAALEVLFAAYPSLTRRPSIVSNA